MTNSASSEPSTGGSALPAPSRASSWRWATPRRALVAGGALAAVLSLGTLAGAATPRAASTRPGATGGPSADPGGPGVGSGRPTVGGKVTALLGDDIVVRTRGGTTTVVSSSGTTFKAYSGAGGSTVPASASSLKVGDFVGVQGRRNGDGTVTASAVVIGSPPRPIGSRPGGRAGGGAPPSGAPSA